MNWTRIQKENSVQPATGTYRDWKPALADEGGHRCVYCCISEAAVGGIWNFHVEHFKPKKKFEALTNVFSNLFYACPICNTFKNDDWPCESGDTNIACYADPSVVDLSEYFQIENDWKLTGKNVCATYMIHMLFLNRPQLILERRTKSLVLRCEELENKLARLSLDIKCSDIPEKAEHLYSIILQMTELSKNSRELFTALPYNRGDVRR